MTSGFDPVISLLVQIKNACLSGAAYLELPHSKYREQVLSVLSKMGLLRFKVFKEEARAFKKVHIDLSTDPTSRRRLTSFRLYSRPGRRIYGNSTKLSFLLGKHKNGVVLSTSKGVLEIKEALKKNLGGELLFEV